MNGIWKGWSYFYSIGEKNFQLNNPININIEKNKILIKFNKKSESIYTISLNELKFTCNSQICDFIEFNKEINNEESRQELGKVEIWITATETFKEKSCLVLEFIDKTPKIFCLLNFDQVNNFKKAVKNAFEILKEREEFNKVEEMKIGSNFEGVFFINNEIHYKGKAELTEKYIVLNNNEIFLKFKQINIVNKNYCDVKLKFNKTQEIFNENCCIQVKIEENLINICLISYDCKERIKELAKRIRNNCESQKLSKIEPSEMNYIEETVENYKEGIWYGWVKKARVILTNEENNMILKEGENLLIPKYMKIDGNDGIVDFEIKKDYNEEKESYKLTKVLWECNGAFPCNFLQFSLIRNIGKKFEKLTKDLLLKFNLENFENCFILSFINNKDFIICPIDINQENIMKLALIKAYDLSIKNADISEIPVIKEGKQFPIELYLDEDKLIKTRVEIQSDSLIDINNGETLIEFNNIENYFNFKCGIEFRGINLPEIFTETYNPECCFSFLSGKKRRVLCINSAFRCIAKNRMLLLKIHLLCFEGKIQQGIISNQEKLMENYQENLNGKILSGYVNNNQEKAIKGEEKNTYVNKDDLLIDRSYEGEWQGKVFFYQLRAKNPKSGKPGFLRIGNNTVDFFSEAVNNGKLNKPIVSFNIIETHFNCENSPRPCFYKAFLNEEKNSIKEIEFEEIKRDVFNFMQINSIKSDNYCFVLEFKHPTLFYYDSYFICPFDKSNVDNLLETVKIAYDKIIAGINLEGEGNNSSIEMLPDLNLENEFKVKIMLPSLGENSNRVIKFDKYKIYGWPQNDVIVKFKDIDLVNNNNSSYYCKVFNRIESNYEENILNEINKVGKKCCFSYFSFERENVICVEEKFRCEALKKVIIKFVRNRCEICKKGEEKDSSMLGNNKEKNIKEYFDFGLSNNIREKSIEESQKELINLDLDKLDKDFINNGNNGEWQGWVLIGQLTQRKKTELLRPLFISLNPKLFGLGLNKNNINKQYPLSSLNWPCINSELPCNPVNYIKTYKDNKNLSFDAIQELSFSLENLLGQLPNRNPSNCMVFDFENSISRIIESILLCNINEPQKNSFIKALNVAYYQSILFADINEEIPLAVYRNEFFNVKIFEENQVVERIIDFNKEGVEIYSSKGLKIRKMLFLYKNIMSDKTGEKCSFWFKNVKLPEKLNVDDNNCCFVWKKNFDSNIIICSNEKFRCVKSTKIMLKKIKNSCDDYFVKNPFVNPYFVNTQKNFSMINNEEFSEKSKGIWKGFANFFVLLNRSNFKEKPHFIDIGIDYLRVFYLKNGVKEEIGKFLILEMEFPCKGETICNINQFLSFNENSGNELNRKIALRELTEIKYLINSKNQMEFCSLVQFSNILYFNYKAI